MFRIQLLFIIRKRLLYMQHMVCIMHLDAHLFGLYYQLYHDARSTECEIYKSLEIQGTGSHNLHKGVT